EQVVRRVDVDPAGRAAPGCQPGVRGVRPDPASLTRCRASPQVATDVAGAQAERAETGDLNVSEVLADAAAIPERLLQGCVDSGRTRIVDEVGVDAGRQVEDAREDRPAGWERQPGVVRQFPGA